MVWSVHGFSERDGRDMKEMVGKYMALTLLIVCAVCGSIGAGSFAKGKGEEKIGAGKDAGAAKGQPDIVTEGESYAYVQLKREDCQILLVTDGTYGYNGLEASFHSEVYRQDADGNWQRQGIIAGSGTAYPIRCDKNGIYVTGGHFAAYYSVDRESMLLVCEEYASETFDENGNATYVYAEDGKTERLVEGNSHLTAMFDRYEQAELVGFRRVEKKDGEK